jgi:ferredoxin
MADITRRVPQNAPGKFYVDDTCIYCDLCVEIVSAIYAEHNDRGWAYVFRQPQTPEEIRLAMEAADSCPTESIGTTGDQHQRVGSIQTLFQRLFPK